jgi:putative transposase
MDSQSVRGGNKRSLNGVDGNRKVKGIKRHVAVDRKGFLIAVPVPAANMADSRAACLLTRVLKEQCVPFRAILANGRYRGNIIEAAKNPFGYAVQVVVGNFREEGFRPIDKRWFVE